MAIEREVAGMRCGEVLAELSDYLDGDIHAERRTQITAHLKGCDVCERFGSTFTTAIHTIRHGDHGQSGENSAVFERLRVRLEKAAGRAWF